MNDIFPKIERIAFPSSSSNLLFFVISALFIALLFVDRSLSFIPYTFSAILANADQPYVYAFFAGLFAICQFIILSATKKRITTAMKGPKVFEVLQRVVTLIQYAISVLVSITAFEIMNYSYYSKDLIITVFILSYSLSCCCLSVLAIRFLAWFRAKRFPSILFYGISSIVFVISNIFVIIFVMSLMENVTGAISEHGHVGFYSDNPDSLYYYLFNGYFICSVAAFILTWIATAIILFNYSSRVGRARIALIISLPLLYFLNQFNPYLFQFIIPLVDINIIFYVVIATVIFSIGKASGGIFFGLAFWISTKKSMEFIYMKRFVVLVTLGYLTLFVSEQATNLISLPYPAFGLISIGSLGMSTYLILIGLYYAAMSVTKDIELRRMIKTRTLNELSILGKLGAAEIDKETEKNVLDVITQNISDHVPESHFSNEEIKQYIDEVLNEIKKIKPKPESV